MVGNRNFNCLLGTSKKFGRRRGHDPSSADFQDFIHQAHLRNLKFSDSPFTWKNNQSGLGRIFERLDRALGNEEWIRSFSNHYIRHLPQLGSNHCALLLTLA